MHDKGEKRSWAAKRSKVKKPCLCLFFWSSHKSYLRSPLIKLFSTIWMSSRNCDKVTKKYAKKEDMAQQLLLKWLQWYEGLRLVSSKQTYIWIVVISEFGDRIIGPAGNFSLSCSNPSRKFLVGFAWPIDRAERYIRRYPFSDIFLYSCITPGCVHSNPTQCRTWPNRSDLQW